MGSEWKNESFTHKNTAIILEIGSKEKGIWKMEKRTRSATKVHLKQGQVIEVPIRRLGINGEGVGHYEKQVVFVDGAIPGEVVRARVTQVEPKFVRAKPVEWKKKSAYRVEPACPVYRECGGCQLQHIDRRLQRRLKRELVEEAFARYAGLEKIPIEPTIEMKEPWGYRNKAQLPVRKVGGQVAMGMFSAKSHRLVDVSDCLVQHPLVNQTLTVAREIVDRLGISIYDEKKHRGVLRHLVARIAFATEEVQLVLITRTESFPQEQAFVRIVTKRLPQVKSIVLNHNPDKTSLVFGDRTRLLWGKEKLEERLGDLVYLLSARAFFQLNPVQTVKMYDEVKKAARLTGQETVVDAYCGVGTIGLWLAGVAKRMIGMDTVPEAIADARENAKRNGITNAEFYVGEAERLLPEWANQGFKPDVVVADPPRTGLGRPFMDTLIALQVPRMVYVSCNPSTLAKDCDRLIKGGYRLVKVVPFDMFPQTAHVETVCELIYHQAPRRLPLL
jgi:23S rRNA (uracil-5-)-methyltransferase RumA